MAGEERKRVYQAWKGNNLFLCQGRLIFGLDASSLIATILLIAVPSIIFCALVARNLFHKFPDHNAGYAILVVAVVFTVYVLGLLLRTSARDPGIVPRNSQPPEEELSYDSGDACSRPAQSVQLPRSKEVMVNGMPVKVKYCETCMLYRPPRCSHCSICNNCVEKFDHHCPWVGQCIGARNYRCFFMFISSSTLLCIFVFSMSALYIKFLMDEHGTVWKAMKKSPASVVLMLYCFIALWFVGGLTGFHSYLISRNQTTYENFRSRTTTSGVNVHDRGCYNNFAEVFFTKTQPSKNKFRAFVQEETPRPARRPMPDPVEETSEDRRAKVETDDLEIGDDIFKLSQRHTVGEAEDINGRGSDNLAHGSSEPDFNLDPESQTDQVRSDIRRSSRSRGASSSFDAATSHLQAFDSIVSGPK